MKKKKKTPSAICTSKTNQVKEMNPQKPYYKLLIIYFFYYLLATNHNLFF